MDKGFKWEDVTREYNIKNFPGSNNGLCVGLYHKTEGGGPILRRDESYHYTTWPDIRTRWINSNEFRIERRVEVKPELRTIDIHVHDLTGHINTKTISRQSAIELGLIDK